MESPTHQSQLIVKVLDHVMLYLEIFSDMVPDTRKSKIGCFEYISIRQVPNQAYSTRDTSNKSTTMDTLYLHIVLQHELQNLLPIRSTHHTIELIYIHIYI